MILVGGCGNHDSSSSVKMEYTEFTCDWHPTLNHVTGEPLATPVLGAHTLTYVVLKQGSVLTTNFVQNETEVLRIPISLTQGTSLNATFAILGDFNFAKILRRQAVEIAIADQIYFTSDQVAVRVSTRSALALTVPAAFMKQSGINA